MARISKKNINNALISDISKEKKTCYNTAIYTRLSKQNSGEIESDTIQNQINIISMYIEDKEELILKETFIDNGYTGVNFDRPDFKRLIDSAKSGKINCLVVKDLSRLGRDYISVGEYLYNIFPSLNLRVISINDNYDSEINKGFDDIVVSLKNLFNATYSRDLSKKITSSLYQKQLNGDYIGGYLYGYKKLNGEKNKLYVDENVKDIVLQIFILRANGASFYKIEEILNNRKIASPKKYLINQGILNKYDDYDSLSWSASTISRLVKNCAYIGHTAQGKVRRSMFEKERRIDKNNWIIVENTHQAIISKELWNKVQQVNEIKIHSGKKVVHKENVFKKLLYCKQCGYVYERKARKFKNSERYHYNYHCRGRKSLTINQKTKCTNMPISEKLLNDILIIIINKYLEILNNISTLVPQNTTLDFYQIEKNKIIIEVNRIKNLKLKLYEKLEKGLVDLDNYKLMYSKFNLDLACLEKKINDFEDHNFKRNNKDQKVKCLNRKILELFIERINIGEDKSIEIIWKYENVFGESAYE